MDANMRGSSYNDVVQEFFRQGAVPDPALVDHDMV